MFSKEMPLLPVHFESVTFTVEEFHRVLEATTIENGYDSSKKRNRYREWLPTAFKLGLHICLRLDELVNLKYCNIIENGGLIFLQGVNRKATNLIDDDQVERIKRVPVIPELYKVLNEECEFEDFEGEEDYIFAQEYDNRVTVKDIIIKGFTHFKRIAGIDDDKKFKDLRKTYISRQQVEYGDIGFTAMISDHGNEEVTRKHYLNQLDAVGKGKDFRVFPEE